MAEITETDSMLLDNRKRFYWSNFLSVATIPLEGAFFFGATAGWPNLVEIYKSLGVYEHVCDEQFQIINGTKNCPQRDVIFT